MKAASRTRPTRRELTVVDIFAGAGGLSSGFAAARGTGGERYKILFAVDRDRQAMQTYRANHFSDISLEVEDQRVCCDDIGMVDAKRIAKAIHPQKRVDVLIGGPSCQGVSPAGLRNPGDKRNQMLLAFVRLVEELQPQWFVLENVPGLTHSNNRELLVEVFKLLEGVKGYQVAGDVLLAADYGVPQLRYRLFLIGTKTGASIRFPKPSHFPTVIAEEHGARLPAYAVLKTAIGDLAQHQPLEIERGAQPVTPDDRIANHWCRSTSKINQERIAPIRNGHDWRDIPIRLLPDRYFTTRSSDQKGSYGRLSWDWPAYTVTNASLNVSAGAFTHPDFNRCLSVREVARVQSFPDSYIFHGSVESQYRQVGNAVPPLQAKAVAEMILNSHFRPTRSSQLGLPGRLTLATVQQSLLRGHDLPTLTPRCTHPAVARGMARKTSQVPGQVRKPPSAWTRSPRPADPWPDDTRRLRMLAKQPKNVRAAKRALSIVQFIDGVPRTKIVSDANSSEASVSKWVDGYFAHGPDGWRAFHSGLEHLAGGSERMKGQIRRAVAKSRRLLLAHGKRRPASGPKRLHMNGYLRDLIQRFGEHSVAGLISKVETHLGASVGTVYVGDLLAVADVVLKSTTAAGRNAMDSRREDPNLQSQVLVRAKEEAERRDLKGIPAQTSRQLNRR
jgi:DNA (cytosine-5)-methyltransferase 1